MRWVIGTGNPGKLREFREVLGPLGVEACPAPAAYADAPPEESGTTFEANARIKLAALLSCTGEIALTDDSGLLVSALNDAPGVHSARYAQAVANMPQDTANRHKLLQALRRVPEDARDARFVAVLALMLPGEHEPRIFRGTCHGRIAKAEAGEGGFGYDALFIPRGFDQTFAQLPGAVKHARSHRGAALAELVATLKAEGRL